MSKIEWTGLTWNCVTGCNKISPGCRSCYAEVMHRRLMALKPEKYTRPFLDGAYPYPPALSEPFERKKPTVYFLPSMSDLFHANIPLDYIAQVWAVMFLNPHHTFQVLTKRADRLPLIASAEFYQLFAKYVNHLHDKYIQPLEQAMYFEEEAIDALPLPNVWIGTSCEDQQRADERIPFLLQTPAAVRFLSCEPLIGPIDILSYKNSNAIFNAYQWKYAYDFESNNGQQPINWVICGGESGHMARPMHPDWARSLRDQCKRAGVPFFFKQWGQWNPDNFDTTRAKVMDDEGTLMYWQKSKKTAGNILDGKTHLAFPNTKPRLKTV
jgi:protein gp37